MKDTYNLSKFRSFTRVRQIVGGIILLLALTLAGPPRLFCQTCNGGATVTSLGVSPGGVVGGMGTTLTASIGLATAGPGTFYAMEAGYPVFSTPGTTASNINGGGRVSGTLFSCPFQAASGWKGYLTPFPLEGKGIEDKKHLTDAVYGINDDMIRDSYSYMTGTTLRCGCKK